MPLVTSLRVLWKADPGSCYFLWKDLLVNLVRDQLPLRPNRYEPRAVKRRPKPYSLLTKPRRQFTEIPHRNRYWKNHSRKNRSLI